MISQITSQPFYNDFFDHLEVKQSYNLMKLQIPLSRRLFQPTNWTLEAWRLFVRFRIAQSFSLLYVRNFSSSPPLRKK